MNKSKKNKIVLTVALVLVAALGGVYFWQDARQRAEALAAAPTPTPPPTRLIEKGKAVSLGHTVDAEATAEVDRLEVQTADETFTLEAVRTQNTVNPEIFDTNWRLADAPDVPLVQSTARDMASGILNLTVQEKYEGIENPAEFGFTDAAPKFTAAYSDGSALTVRVGKETPAKDRYYVMLDGDPTVYTVFTYTGERFHKGLNDLVDKTAAIGETSEAYEYLLIAERDKPEIEFGFYGTEEEKAEMVEQFGVAYMTMLKPYEGRQLYTTNLDEAVMKTLSAFSIGDLVELQAADLSKYGLDKPALTLRLKDPTADLHLLFGDTADDGRIYVKYADRSQVFLAAYDPVRPLFNLDVFGFIDRFISLTNIAECAGIVIELNGEDPQVYDCVIEHETDEDGNDVVIPSVNGQSVQELAFKTFYQYVIGLSYDADIGSLTPAGDEVMAITFKMLEGDPVTVHFYDYNANFYALRQNDDPVRYVTNKQAVNTMLSAIPDLLSGALDRDH